MVGRLFASWTNIVCICCGRFFDECHVQNALPHFSQQTMEICRQMQAHTHKTVNVSESNAIQIESRLHSTWQQILRLQIFLACYLIVWRGVIMNSKSVQLKWHTEQVLARERLFDGMLVSHEYPPKRIMCVRLASSIPTDTDTDYKVKECQYTCHLNQKVDR